ncbi:vps9 domain [Lecanosticta acicola]|uniref:Vps9 domain n=1 Tax=Lecanosticta acicola TaxID=111012 RepID=A0AAI8YXL9_9PEZI|nr:vps9 domain [Lecanosticta acicola]
MIVTLLATETRKPTDLETYLSRTLALALLALAGLTVLLSGMLPLTNDLSRAKEEDVVEGKMGDPYAYPTLVVTTIYQALSAFYLYTQIASAGWSFGFGMGLVATSTLFCMGIWVLLFASEKGRISKSTGADKRTSNFPFTNETSAREKKKESKQQRKSLSSKSR